MIQTSPWSWVLLSLLCAACSAESPKATLLLQLETDLVAGIEFVGVDVALWDDPTRGAVPGDRRARHFAAADSVLPLRAAEFEGLTPGIYALRIQLLDSGGQVRLERPAVVEVSGNTSATMIMTRNCEGVACPGSGDDASALACLGGRCVDPRCTPETSEFCPASECTSGNDCPAVASCADSRCAFSVCLPLVRSLSCAAGEWCNPQLGCLPTARDHCVDGFRNESETGVDCGGACRPCLEREPELPEGWTRTISTPVGNLDIEAIWGASDDDVWAIAEGGLVMRHQNGEWLNDPSLIGSESSSFGRAGRELFGVGPNAVWAFGVGLTYRWDGISWRYSDLGYDVDEVWGVAEDDLWAETGEALLHWDGSSWSEVYRGEGTEVFLGLREATRSTFHEMHGTASDDVWAIIWDRVYRWNGSVWTQHHQAVDVLDQLWAFASDDVWIIGQGGTEHWDGERWALVATDEETPFGTSRVWGSPGGTLWALDVQSLGDGALGHWDGDGWILESAPCEASALWGWSDAAVRVGGAGNMALGAAGGWTVEFGACDGNGFFAGGTGSNERWMLRDGSVYRWDGAAWNFEYSAPEDSARSVQGLSGTGANNLWMVGKSGFVAGRTEAGWSVAPSVTSQILYEVSAPDPNVVVAVGLGGTVVRFDGVRWVESTLPTRYLNSVWAANGDSVWVSGNRNDKQTFYWNGATWQEDTSVPGFGQLHGSADDNVWGVTDPGVSGPYRWDGSSWTLHELDGCRRLWTVSPTETYCITNTEVFRWDGSQWTRFDVDLGEQALRDVWSDGNELWVAGVGVYRFGP